MSTRKDPPDILVLEGVAKRYPWGSKTFIQKVLGLQGEESPFAELWFGTHERGPAQVPKHGTDLVSLGKVFGADFLLLPFLTKILAAAKPLSIQCHPTKAQAVAGFEKENFAGIAKDDRTRLFPDDNHKPEVLVALTDFEALSGFRASSDIQRLFAKWAPTSWDALTKLGETDTSENVFNTLLMSQSPLGADKSALSTQTDDPVGRWLIALDAQYPSDCMKLAPLLFNYVALQPMEGIYLGARQPHAYLRGAGVEVMASSDNVLRCGLTNKHVDKTALAKIVDFSPHSPAVIDKEIFTRKEGFSEPNNAFSIRVIQSEQSPRTVKIAKAPALLLCTEGTIAIKVGSELRQIKAGAAALLPSAADAQLDGHGTVFLVTG